MREYFEISSVIISLFIGIAILFSVDLNRIVEVIISGVFISFPIYVLYKLFLSLRNRDGNNNKA